MKTKQTTKPKKTISVVLPLNQVAAIETIARDQHRSVSGQIAFFCAAAVARQDHGKPVVSE